MDPLAGGGDGIFATLVGFFRSPVEHYGLALAATSIAVGLVVRWVRRAVHV